MADRSRPIRAALPAHCVDPHRAAAPQPPRRSVCRKLWRSFGKFGWSRRNRIPRSNVAQGRRDQRERAMAANAINVGKLERVGSAVGGAALILRAIAHPTVARVVAAIGGAALLQRGLTGHCALYDRLGFDTA